MISEDMLNPSSYHSLYFKTLCFVSLIWRDFCSGTFKTHELPFHLVYGKTNCHWLLLVSKTTLTFFHLRPFCGILKREQKHLDSFLYLTASFCGGLVCSHPFLLKLFLHILYFGVCVFCLLWINLFFKPLCFLCNHYCWHTVKLILVF